MPNLIATSSQASLTEEPHATIAETPVKNLLDFEATGGSPNELCYHCGKTDDCRQGRRTKCF